MHQIQGKNRAIVAKAGADLGLDGTYTPHSYIEQVQLQHLTNEFNEATRDLKSRLMLDSMDEAGFSNNFPPPSQKLVFPASPRSSAQEKVQRHGSQGSIHDSQRQVRSSHSLTVTV